MNSSLGDEDDMMNNDLAGISAVHIISPQMQTFMRESKNDSSLYIREVDLDNKKE